RPHPDVELRFHIDTHPVARDQSLVLITYHLQSQRVHADRRHVMNDRPDECAAIDHHLLTEKTGPHEGNLLGGASVKPRHHPVDDGDDDDGYDEPKDELADDLPGH